MPRAVALRLFPPAMLLSRMVPISISWQRLFCKGRCYVISTGRAGIGFGTGSGKTPTGRFAVCPKHGENAPLATVFRGRLPVGRWPEATRGNDAILARILCLDGLDAANANTRASYIYIHGTCDTASLGLPVSYGCIRMAPADVAELYALVPLGADVVMNY